MLSKIKLKTLLSVDNKRRAKKKRPLLNWEQRAHAERMLHHLRYPAMQLHPNATKESKEHWESFAEKMKKRVDKADKA